MSKPPNNQSNQSQIAFPLFLSTPLNIRLDVVGSCLPTKYFEPSTRLLSIASRSDHYFSPALIRLIMQVRTGHQRGFSISLSRHLSKEITSPDQHRCHHRSKVEMITRQSSLFSSITDRHRQQVILHIITYDREI